MARPTVRGRWWVGLLLGIAGPVGVLGCSNAPVNVYDGDRSPAPLRLPPPDGPGEDCCYEDALTGGHIFAMYCGSCHNARSLAERPFSNYKNVAVHMRVRAYLTGQEYEKLLGWLRRWHDVPPPNPPVEPSPKRLIFSRPVAELRGEAAAAGQAPAGSRPGPTGAAREQQPGEGTAQPAGQ
jgi:hypothetical protein